MYVLIYDNAKSEQILKKNFLAIYLFYHLYTSDL